MFQNKTIGILSSEPWKHETEEGDLLLVRVAIFKPIVEKED
tara:strand:- start:121463 stop:121585 length:123 start_codon:yes stop_codon:yes gene_type:complete